MLDSLPDSSFVPFSARKLSQPLLHWSNPDIAGHLDFFEHSYCIPHPNDPEEYFSTEWKIFQAERYGGRGVGSNGGGARCGFDGKIQIKGIGRNPLVGRDTDFWHAHGGANLEEAIREAVWGEICHRVLPFGGVRCLQIIGTGTQSHFENSQGNRTLPRALIVREAAVRPAHFMRAINHAPSDGMDGQPHDTERTRAAAAVIGTQFKAMLGWPQEQPVDAQLIQAGLSEMVKRFAWQVAAARAKRMPHGALNCSNIALDGRFLDYETISTLPDHGRVITARGNPDSWNGHTSLSATLVHLLFYLRNYLPGGLGKQLDGAQRWISEYLDQYQQRLEIEYLKLTGLGEGDIHGIDPAPRALLWKSIQSLIAQGNAEPFKIPAMPPQTGRFHLNSIIQSAARGFGKADLAQVLIDEIPDPDLRNDFCRALGAIWPRHLQSFPGGSDWKNHVIRLNTSLPELAHPYLEKSILCEIDSHDSCEWVAPFIEDLIERGSYFLSDSVNTTLDSQWYLSSSKTTFPAQKAPASHYRVQPDGSETVTDRAALLGYAAKLMSQSPAHVGAAMRSLRLLVTPALAQHRIKFYFNEDGQPVGFVVWAFLDEDVEQRVISTAGFQLHESEWNEGRRLWIVDLVAPMGNARYILRDLRDAVFADAPEIQYLRRRRAGAMQHKHLRRRHTTSFFGRIAAANVTAVPAPVLRARPCGLAQVESQAVGIADRPFEDDDDRDLHAFGEAVGDATLVVLGQQTHGCANAMTLKARMVRYLQAHKGFRVLALEGGSFDTARTGELVDGGLRHEDAAQGALFHMVAQASCMAPFFDYLDQQRARPQGLRLEGFHTKHTGVHAMSGLCDRLRQLLAPTHSMLFDEAGWQFFQRHAESAMRMDAAPPEPGQLERLAGMFRSLHDALKTLPEGDGEGDGPLLQSPAYWRRTLTELERQGERYWGIRDDWVSRERWLAQSLLWLQRERYRGDKMIVWTHNIHAQRNAPSFKMGATLSAALGESMVSVGFTGGTGRFTDWISGGIAEIPEPPIGSLEEQLGRRKHPACLLDLRAPAIAQALSTLENWRYKNYGHAGFPVTQAFDLVVHLQQVQPVMRRQTALREAA
ncbi:toxin-activating lysine-acyltransferase [Piscinibacter terrae]|uniref:RTX toxin-activating lysine-acyltransferase n=1 Tax=Piscinibacter terrae TaxID=2496871 RepID=A0A3N7JXR0_9BURK|nr:erythromycin esterase family protein [Albitalea terrae]RQP23675.1 toxin-activating lysine-acyltransferase [Albitalea terrae]